MRVTLRNGVTLEFDSTGMVEDFRECAQIAEDSGYEECKDCETCKCNIIVGGTGICTIPEVVEVLMKRGKGEIDLDTCSLEETKSLLRKYYQNTSQKPIFDGFDGFEGMFRWSERICPYCGSKSEEEYETYERCPCCRQKMIGQIWNRGTNAWKKS